MRILIPLLYLLSLGCSGDSSNTNNSTQQGTANSGGSGGTDGTSGTDATDLVDGSDGSTGDKSCVVGETSCVGADVYFCQTDGKLEFAKSCSSEQQCVDGACACKPQCDGKACGDDGCGGVCGTCSGSDQCSVQGTCQCVPSCEDKECGDDGCGGPCGLGCPDGVECSANGICGCTPSCTDKQCGSDGCGGSCGECPDGGACSQNGLCGCTPSCDGKTCGDDGCGGLCNSCLDISYDDGTVDTARGWGEEPSYKPQKLGCFVRYKLPAKNMKLLHFIGRWMWGLVNIGTPFDLVYVSGSSMDCKSGGDTSWYEEYCEVSPDKLVTIGNFKPEASGGEVCGVSEKQDDDGKTVKSPKACTLLDEQVLGEVVFPEKNVFIGTVFTVDTYPFYPCPIDTTGQGSNAFYMPLYGEGDDFGFKGAALLDKEENAGTIPFSIRVKLTN